MNSSLAGPPGATGPRAGSTPASRCPTYREMCVTPREKPVGDAAPARGSATPERAGGGVGPASVERLEEAPRAGRVVAIRVQREDDAGGAAEDGVARHETEVA